jgi:hypothetical protein
MNINFIAVGLMTLLMGFYTWKAWTMPSEAHIQHFLPFTPIDVRKTKVYVSQTRDAGMFVERQRRLAILTNRNGGYSYKNSTNGYLEYALTALCVCPVAAKDICPPAPDVVWDGGNATSEVCDIVDGGDAYTEAEAVDFGDAFTNVCDV